MLLILDVSNRQTSVALADNGRFRTRTIASDSNRTSDDYGLLLEALLERLGQPPGTLDGAIIGSVVPAITPPLRDAVEAYLGVRPVVVGPGVRTGIRIRTDNPREVGADRIANVLAAQQRFGSPVIVVDFGTPTTFDVVAGDGAYIGSSIAPGLDLSLDALTARTAQLRSVPLAAPASAIGSNTTAAIQSGIVFGMAALVDGMVGRIRAELGVAARVVATGRHAELVQTHCQAIDVIDANLTLDGLRLIWQHNVVANR